MSLKNWILRRMNGLTARVDLPPSAPRSPVLSTGDLAAWPAGGDAPSVPRAGTQPHKPSLRSAPHLGPYAPLVNAVRDELEHFVTRYLRLHLAIAEHDRYLLTSIDVQATGRDEDAELLERFIREFRPEQIKEYFAREIIGALPNAAAIDLSQFAGLNADRSAREADDEAYSKLLAELRDLTPAQGVRAFEVSLIGRWSTLATAGGRGARVPAAERTTQIGIEDGDGARRIELGVVTPGRRYSIGKGEGCDIGVKGVYASRRHCEIWLDRGVWWLTDTGSTNGVRVERGSNVLGRSVSERGSGREPAMVEVAPGARIVLSAHAEGSAGDYPRLVLDPVGDAGLAPTPIAPAVGLRATPATPIRGAHAEGSALMLRVQMASGAKALELRAGDLPFAIGRSRKARMVIDWAHEGVSGHHVDIVAIDDEGASIAVHGDNGVGIDGEHFPPGSRLHWAIDKTMVLGRVVGREPECRLTLSRRL